MVLPRYVFRQAGVTSVVFFLCIVAVWPLVALCLRRARHVERGAVELATS
jgi:uncharacterized membrane protein YhaH (DUF805 family)